MAKLTLEERRLQNLKRQLYGKSRPATAVKNTDSSSPKISFSFNPTTENPTSTSLESVRFLKTDLVKIAILAVIAFGAQIILFILSKNHLINLNLHF